MDCSVKKQQISVQKLFADLFDERPLDCDFVLPEYMPDVATVLKSTMTPMVQSKQRSGERLLVEGTVTVRTLYLDEGRRCVRSCEFSQPFSSSFLLKEVPDDVWVTVSAKSDYINCRAVSPRRLDAHGAFTVKAKVFGTQREEIVSGIEGESLYTKSETVRFSVPAAYIEKCFSVNETAELDVSAPPAEFIVRSEATAVVQECRKMNGKAILKGEISAQVLYCSDALQGTLHRISRRFPFSQLVDVEGMREDWWCEAGAEVTSCDIHAGQNQNGENTLLTVSVKLCAFIECYQEDQAQLVTDAYSCLAEMELTGCRAMPQRLLWMQGKSDTLRQTVEMPSQEAIEVLDLWAQVMPAGIEYEREQTVFSARVMLCMLVRERDGQISYYERVADYTDTVPVACDAAQWRITAPCCTFSVTGDGRVELCIDLDMSHRCYVNEQYGALAQAQLKQTPYPADAAAIRICFVGAGETVWDIAKRCRTCPERIREENGLSDDVLGEDTMLLIPLC